MNPALSLWAAVLLRAIYDLHRLHVAGGAEQKRRAAARARAWFLSSNIDPASFRWVCAILEIDHHRTRRTIFQLDRDILRERAHLSTIPRVHMADFFGYPPDFLDAFPGPREPMVVQRSA